MFPDIKPQLSHVERILTDFSNIKKPTTADFMAYRSRLLMGGYLDRYRSKANEMSDNDLINEKHSSKRLSGYMRRSGDSKPSNHCVCHHMISGGHTDAALMRLVMVSMAMRIDDPHNGCWLPNDWEDRAYMPNHLRKAVPHKRIHTKNYYRWLAGRINMVTIQVPDQLIHELRFARRCLQSGAVPPNVMPTTGLAS